MPTATTPSTITTEHSGAVAITAIHDRAFDRRLGGVRFVERGSVAEVQHLAAGMAEKCAASRVPLGGQKTLVICPDGVPNAPRERAAILARHIEHVLTEDDGGIFGPDMACGDDVLDLLAVQPGLAGHVTGLSESRDGLDINRHGFTARGVVHALDTYATLCTTALHSASIQGFGMVGAPVARALAERGFAVRAISNWTGVLIDAAGIDVPRLFALWRESGDDCLTRYASEGQPGATFDPDANALFDVRADLFVPAARTTVLALCEELDDCRVENADVRPVEAFLDRSRCAVVLQAANHPLTTGAEAYLERHGVAVLPDVLVNVGGMVGCYAEWRYRERVRSGALSIATLAERCHDYTARSVEENVRGLVWRDESARCATSSIVMRNRAAMLADRSSRQDLFALEC